MSRASGLLVDLDGTLYSAGRPLEGGPAALRQLGVAGIPLRYLTNTTRVSRRALAERLRGFGYPAEEGDLFTAPLAAARLLAGRGIRSIGLYAPGDVREDFAEFDLDSDQPEAVVVGDLGRAWTFDQLNRAFLQVMDGALLVAVQKNRYWRTDSGLELDAGPFVAALEYATAREATVVGKPNPEFFRLAAAALEVDPGEVVVVGDDIEADVGGAIAAGLRGVLVRTGKFREEAFRVSGVNPEAVLDSIAQLPLWLGELETEQG